MSTVHHYLAFPKGGAGSAKLAKIAQSEKELHDLDGIMIEERDGARWRIVASEMILPTDGPDVATYYMIPASVPPHHEALYLSQAIVSAATK